MDKKTKIGWFVSTLFGCLIIWYVIYIRLFRERLPQDLNVSLSWPAKLIFMDMFIFCLCITIYWLVKIYRVHYPRKGNFENKYLIAFFQPIFDVVFKVINYINNLIFASLRQVDTSFKIILRMCNIELHIKFTQIFCQIRFTYKWHEILKNLRTIVFLFVDLPRTLVLISLIMDVFFFKQLYYFYLVGILLFIPLFFHYLCYTFNEQTIACLHEFDPYIWVIRKSTNEIYEFSAFALHRAYSGEEYNYRDWVYTFTKNDEPWCMSHMSLEEIHPTLELYEDMLCLSTKILFAKQNKILFFEFFYYFGLSICWFAACVFAYS